jgi:adenylate cyclase
VLEPLLNEYLTGMTEVVFAHDGTVAKIVGDALHVLFGAPGEQLDHATRAIMCSLALDAFAREFRQGWNERGVALGVTRIGVHAGPAIVGNFGGSRFFEYTAYGDTINVAARLESANKQLGTSICVSGDVAARAEGFVGRPIGDLLLKGRSEPICALEPQTPEEFAALGTGTYLRAFAMMESGDPGSISAFAGLVGSRERDELASFHLKRLLNGATGTRIALD